nr:lectin BMA - Bowringia mildbraedii [Leucomphalos mildbraedii]
AGSDNGVVAVEFDTYPNTDIGDPNYRHIGIDVNSIRSKAASKWDWQNGKTATAHISYNSASKRLSVVSSYPNSSPVVVSFDVELNNVGPPDVRVGFSATTGQYTQTNNILAWSFRSSLMGYQANANSVCFTFTDFESGQQDLIFQGDASVGSNKALQLTKVDSKGNPQGGSVGRALYTAPIRLWQSSSLVASFETTFTFSISQGSSTPAAALTFFIASPDTKIPSGSGGRLLGLFGSSNN